MTQELISICASSSWFRGHQELMQFDVSAYWAWGVPEVCKCYSHSIQGCGKVSEHTFAPCLNRMPACFPVDEMPIGEG